MLRFKAALNRPAMLVIVSIAVKPIKPFKRPQRTGIKAGRVIAGMMPMLTYGHSLSAIGVLKSRIVKHLGIDEILN